MPLLGMAFGTHTTVEFLAARLLHRWVPKWYGAFCDGCGGFYERLGRGFKPVFTGTRRLLTQCRQLSMYSHAAIQPDSPASFCPDLKKHFDFILEKYHIPETGGWRFSLDDDLNPLDEKSDLYSLSFVIFSFAHYFRASGDERARDHALKTIDFIDTAFRFPDLPGLAEALDENSIPVPGIRRQNPHMHLLEACLLAYETWKTPQFLRIADEMVVLFHDCFYKSDTGHLCEFFTNDLHPHPEEGHKVEPGHYFEWVWLLKKHAALTNNPKQHDDVCEGLLRWANRAGWDERYGGIYDVLSPDGRILADSKRLWPFTEALKANAMMLDSGFDRDALKERISAMVDVFSSGYMQERGFWTEWLSRDLAPQTDYMPGTTPYHVYFGIMETREYLHARGASVSFAVMPLVMGYRLRRKLSSRVKRLKNLVSGV